MKLIIDIPDKAYNKLLEEQHLPNRIDLEYFIVHGTPFDSCEDCISRKEIQDYIAKYLSQYMYDDIRSAVETIDEYIGDMPSVQPIRPKGKWIKSDIPESVLHKCSNCGWNLGSYTYKFCPKCAADMRGDN